MSRVDAMLRRFVDDGGMIAPEHDDAIARAREAEARVHFPPSGGVGGAMGDVASLHILEWQLWGNMLGRCLTQNAEPTMEPLSNDA